MYKTNIILFAILLFIFSSCNNTLDENTMIYNNQNIEQRSQVDPILCADLQWTAYIIAGMLYEDEDDLFRSEFIDYSESGGTVYLSTLFENPDFNSRFTELTFFYFEEESGIGIDKATRPTNKPAKPPRGIIDGDEVQANFFLTAVKSYDCTEIYFPKELDFDNAILSITSTAHPLNTALNNEGYKWELNTGVKGDYIDVMNVDVDNEYVDDNDNVIVARPVPPLFPVPSQTLGDCGFLSKNNSVDFTIFLSQD